MAYTILRGGRSRMRRGSLKAALLVLDEVRLAAHVSRASASMRCSPNPDSSGAELLAWF